MKMKSDDSESVDIPVDWYAEPSVDLNTDPPADHHLDSFVDHHLDPPIDRHPDLPVDRVQGPPADSVRELTVEPVGSVRDIPVEPLGSVRDLHAHSVLEPGPGIPIRSTRGRRTPPSTRGRRTPPSTRGRRRRPPGAYAGSLSTKFSDFMAELYIKAGLYSTQIFSFNQQKTVFLHTAGFI